MRRKLLTLVVAIVVIASLVLVGCVEPAAPPVEPVEPVEPTPTPTPAPTVKELLDGISTTTYGMGGNSFAESAAYAEAIFKKFGIRIRVVPGESDAERIWPLKRGEATFANLSASMMYTFQQGTGELFSQWGPQKIRAVWMLDRNRTGYGVRRDSDIKTFQDIKGHRWGMIKGYKSWEDDRDGMLAYANLTLDDIEQVYFSTSADCRLSLARRESDVTLLNLIGSATQQVWVACGFRILPMPASETEAWDRIHKVLPMAMPLTMDGSGGAVGATPENPWYGMSYPEGFWCLPETDDDVVYALCKVLDETYDLALATSPFVFESSLEYQVGTHWWYGYPLHPGTIRYLKDKGVWPSGWDELQKKALQDEAELVGG